MLTNGYAKPSLCVLQNRNHEWERGNTNRGSQSELMMELELNFKSNTLDTFPSASGCLTVSHSQCVIKRVANPWEPRKPEGHWAELFIGHLPSEYSFSCFFGQATLPPLFQVSEGWGTPGASVLGLGTKSKQAYQFFLKNDSNMESKRKCLSQVWGH